MIDLALGTPSVHLGELAHRDEHRLEKYGLAQDILQRVDRAGTISHRAIDERADEQTDQRAKEAEEIITRNETDKLEQDYSRETDEIQLRQRRALYPRSFIAKSGREKTRPCHFGMALSRKTLMGPIDADKFYFAKSAQYKTYHDD